MKPTLEKSEMTVNLLEIIVDLHEKHNLLTKDIAKLFGLSTATVSSYLFAIDFAKSNRRISNTTTLNKSVLKDYCYKHNIDLFDQYQDVCENTKFVFENKSLVFESNIAVKLLSEINNKLSILIDLIDEKKVENNNG